MGAVCSSTPNDVSEGNKNRKPVAASPIRKSDAASNPLVSSSLMPGFAVVKKGAGEREDDADALEGLVTFNRSIEDALSDISEEVDEGTLSCSDDGRGGDSHQKGGRHIHTASSNGRKSSGGLSNSGEDRRSAGSTPSPPISTRSGLVGRPIGTLQEGDRTKDVPDIDAELFVYDDVVIPKVLNEGSAHRQLVASRRAFLASSGAPRYAGTSNSNQLKGGPTPPGGNFQFNDFQISVMVDELDRAVSMSSGQGLLGDDDDLEMDISGDVLGHPPGEGQNRTSPTGIDPDEGSRNLLGAHLASATRAKTPTRARTPSDGSRMNEANTFGSSMDNKSNMSSFTSSFTEAGGNSSNNKADDKHRSTTTMDDVDSDGGAISRVSSSVGSIPEGAVMLRSGTTCRSITITNRSAQLRLMQQMAKIAKLKNYTRITNFSVRTLIGHSCRVKCIAIAPGEKEYVSCSNEDAVVTLYSLVDGKEIANFPGHRDTVISSAFSPDGKFLATTSRDHTMILWDVVTAKQILTFDHAKVVICCVFSRDSRFVATGCQDKVCRLWETRRGKETVIFSEHDGIIISMAYSPNNQYIASASADRTIRVWSTHNGKSEHVLRGHTGIVLSCSFTNDSKRIISNDEKALKVWSTTTGDCLKTILVEDVARGAPIPLGMRKLTWTLSTVAPGLFSRFLIAACNNRFVYVLDVVTGEELASYFCKAPVYCLNTGHQHTVGFGDSFGNVYIATID